MFTNRKVRLGAIVTGASMLIGAAAGLKALATPVNPASAAPQSSTAIGGSVSVAGTGNSVVGGSVNGIGAGNGNVNIFNAPVTNVPLKPADKAADSVNSVSEKIHGRWNDDFAYPTTLGRNEVKGYTTFLKNGSYNFQGTETVHAKAQGREVVIQFAVSDAGKWVARDGLLTIESTGMRSNVAAMTIDGASIDIAKLSLLGMPQPRLEDYVAPNVGTEFSLVSVSKTELHLTALAPTGSKFAVIATRQANT
jgi:hypothetical protein